MCSWVGCDEYQSISAHGNFLIHFGMELSVDCPALFPENITSAIVKRSRLRYCGSWHWNLVYVDPWRSLNRTIASLAPDTRVEHCIRSIFIEQSASHMTLDFTRELMRKALGQFPLCPCEHSRTPNLKTHPTNQTNSANRIHICPAIMRSTKILWTHLVITGASSLRKPRSLKPIELLSFIA